MRSADATITKSVLKWARVQAGYSQEEAARKARVATEKYKDWEDEDKREVVPTIKQLRSIARIFKRPVSLFYLADSPESFQPMHDFCKLPGKGPQIFCTFFFTKWN